MLCRWMSKTIGNEMYFLFRIIVGVMFFLHGAQKFGWFGSNGSIAGFAGAFNLPIWLAGVSAFIEVTAGVLIVLGLFSRPAALFGSLNMIASLILAHFPKGWHPLETGAELPLLYFAAFLVILIFGARKYSLEKAMFNKEYL